MNNWSSGWRKLVEWDNKNKVYIYKGKSIIPLTIKERIAMPVHLQNEYYWEEIKYIEDRLNSFNNKSEEPSNKIDSTLDMLWNLWEN